MQTLKCWGSSSLLTKYLDSENTSRLPRNFKIAAKYYFQIKHIHGCVEFNDLLGIFYFAVNKTNCSVYSYGHIYLQIVQEYVRFVISIF